MIDRIKKLEKSVQQLARRSPNRALAIAPPIVVSFYAQTPEEDGTLCSFVSPFNGIVKTIAFSSQEIQIAKDMHATITHEGALHSTWSIPVKYHRFVEHSEYAIGAGDVITVGISNPDMVKRVSVSIVLQCDSMTNQTIKVELDKLLLEMEHDA